MTGATEIHGSEPIARHQALDDDIASVNAHIGGRLRQARERAGVSQAEFARQLAIPRGRLSEYETGTRQLTVNDLIEACSLLKINPLYLFDDDGDAAVLGPVQPPLASEQVGAEAEAVVHAFTEIPDQDTRDAMKSLLRAMGTRHSV